MHYTNTPHENRATNQGYTATAIGTYTVTITNAYGCTKTSSSVSVVSSCKESDAENGQPVVPLYPNPNYGDFFIDISLPNVSALINDSQLMIAVTDLTGRTVYAEKIQGKAEESSNPLFMEGRQINLAPSLTGGVNIVKVESGEHAYYKSLLLRK